MGKCGEQHPCYLTDGPCVTDLNEAFTSMQGYSRPVIKANYKICGYIVLNTGSYVL